MISESGRNWEGRTVDGKFVLESYLGGSDHSVVFLTLTANSERAAIKLISADSTSAEQQLGRWRATSEITHPNLIRIFATGRCRMDDTELLYVVMEYAEENILQILPERALTADEARGMLPTVLETVQFLHDKRYVHGRIQPSNILAIGDQIKLSSDTLALQGEKVQGARAIGAYDAPEAATGEISAATDVWQLGMTLIEVLTQHSPVWNREGSIAPTVPSSVPEPFREIAGNCLQIDAGKRWTIAEISDRLRTDRPGVRPGQASVPVSSPMEVRAVEAVSTPVAVARKKVSKKWSYLLGLAAVLAIAFVLIPKPKSSGPVIAVQTQPDTVTDSSTTDRNQTLPQTGQDSSQRSIPSSMPNSGAAPDAKTGEAKAEDAGPSADGVVTRVMPQVSPSARRTIQGKIKIHVKVEVDAAGNVKQARLESGGASKYFSRLAVEAARDWKFSPASAGDSRTRQWKLQFAFSRARTEASVVRGKN
jgi:TonB family protein